MYPKTCPNCDKKRLANEPEEPFIHASENTFGRLSTVIIACRKQTRYDTTKQITDVLCANER